MEKFAPQNGYFFVRFVIFTSTLMYNVIWNHSQVNYEETQQSSDKNEGKSQGTAT